MGPRTGISAVVRKNAACRRDVGRRAGSRSAGRRAWGLGAHARPIRDARNRSRSLLAVRRTYRYLSTNGLLIGANDLWIAAIAIRHEVELVTRNARHFRRVPGLRVDTHEEATI